MSSENIKTSKYTAILNKPILFIIGAPRSGSSWLHQLIGAHPEVASSEATEIAHFNTYILAVQKIWEKENRNIEERQWKLGLPTIWSDEKFLEFQQAFTSEIYSSILEKTPNAKCILDRHGGYSYSLDLIRSFLPNAKFIHLLRDGREVALSAVSSNARKAFGPSDIYKAAEAWSSYSLAACEAEQFGNDNYFEIRYESLLDKPKETLNELFDFCTIDANPNLVDNIYHKHFNERLSHPNPDRKDYKTALWKREMSFWQKVVFNKRAGKTMMKLKYMKDLNEMYSSSFGKIFSKVLSPFVNLYYWPRHGLKPLLRRLLKTEKT